MTTAAGSYPLIGAQPVGNFNNAVELASATSGYVPLIPVGTIYSVVDPYWGGLELIRLSIPVSTAVKVGEVSTITSTFGFVAVPNTANLGQSVAISISPVASNATYVQYGWFAISGRYPIRSGASVTADTAFGITAAGVVGAIANGKQILNARVQVAATTTVAKTAQTVNGSTIIKVTATDGWFVGVAVTGTGIPASTVISTIDQDNRSVTLSAAATATGSVTATGTYNDGTTYWNIATFQRPFAQGQTA